MRWIFISLMLVNGAVFIWSSVESGRQERIAALNTTPASDVGVVSGAPLILVSELTETERANLGNMLPPEPEVEQPQAPVTPPAAPVEQSQQPSEAPIAKIGMPEKVVLPKGEQVKLEPNQCLLLGPVAIKQTEQLSQRLLAVGIVSELIDVDVKGAPEYWVVLPPLPDSKSALQKLQELQGRGVQAQILPAGPLANAISFGLSGQKSEADKLADEVKSKGYRAEVRAVPVIRKEKWLNLSERQAPKLNDEVWQGLQQDFPRMEKRIKSCH